MTSMLQVVFLAFTKASQFINFVLFTIKSLLVIVLLLRFFIELDKITRNVG